MLVARAKVANGADGCDERCSTTLSKLEATSTGMNECSEAISPQTANPPFGRQPFCSCGRKVTSSRSKRLWCRFADVDGYCAIGQIRATMDLRKTNL
jgi:hypothetical protein